MIKPNNHRGSAPAAIPQASAWNPAAGLRMRVQRVRQAFEVMVEARASEAMGGGPTHKQLDAAVRQLLDAAVAANLQNRPADGSLLPLIEDLQRINQQGEEVLHPNTQFHLRQLLVFTVSLALDRIEAQSAETQRAAAPIVAGLEALGLHVQDALIKCPTEPQRPAPSAPHGGGDSFTPLKFKPGHKPVAPGPRMPFQALSAPSRLRRPTKALTPGGLDQVSHHLPFDALPARLVSVKVKWPKELYANEPFAGSQYSKLYDDRGKCFVMSGKILQGSSGKLHYAFDMEKPNEMLAIKAMRHNNSRRRRDVSQPRTRANPRELTRFESQMTVAARDLIEQKMAALDALPVSHPDSLKKARSHAMPFVLHGYAENPAKSYMIMSKDLGDIGQLAPSLSAEDKQFATQSLWAQATTELQFLHSGTQVAHLDLSTANIFFTASGQFKIMDFGLIEPLVGSKTEATGIRGNIVTPEAMSFGVEGAKHVLGSATDVFALGVVTALFAAPSDVQNIFHHSYRAPGTASAEASRQALMLAYVAWREAVTDGSTGRITASGVLQGPNDAFRALFAPLAQSNPEVCEAVLNEAMAIDPEKRQTAAALGVSARLLLPSNTLRRDQLIASIGANRNTSEEDRLYEEIEMYDEWDKQQTQAEQARIGAQVGRARNLPG